MRLAKKKTKEIPAIARPGLREKLLAKLAADSFGEEERDVPVVARMNKKVVITLDSLVALGIFKSRSEAAAALVEAAISSREDLFNEIREQATSLGRTRDEAMKEAQDAVLERLG
jgi:Arc/MetJ-type ribon-helix-helix transcriptional regulator